MRSPNSKVALCLLLLLGIGNLCRVRAQNVPPPAKVAAVFEQGPVSFRYPQNWQIVDRKGNDEILIAPPEAAFHPLRLGYGQTKRKDRKHQDTVVAYSHGLVWGQYEPNLATVKGAADELLGRFRQRFPQYFSYIGEDVLSQVNGRPALWRRVEISDSCVIVPVAYCLNQSGGFLFVILDKDRVWYWVLFSSVLDEQQYDPTFAAIMASISFQGKRFALNEQETDVPVTSSETLSATEIARRSLPSVVMLIVQDGSGRPLKSGTGFFVRKGVVATNFHVIRDGRQAYVRLVGQDARYPVLGVFAADKDRDLALLAIAGDSHAPALPLSTDLGLAVGETVYVVGNPEGLEGTFSQGIVSSVRGEGENAILQITAPISAGSSGGPVLDRRGTVVGVAFGMIEGGQNLNFAIPASHLANLLSRTGPPVPLTEFADRTQDH